MQDKYVGDIGDFGKYCLLKELHKQSEGKIRIGINWYFVDLKENTNKDGGHTEYLNKDRKDIDKFRSCSPDLYEKLHHLIKAKDPRSVSAIEEGGFLPAGTLFYRNSVSDCGTSSEKREKWLNDSYDKIGNADVIFLDPDNGIRLNESKAKLWKQALPEEIRFYFKHGKSVIIYKHEDHSPQKQREEYYSNLQRSLDISIADDIRFLRFSSWSARYYIFLVQENHRCYVDRTFAALTQPPYDHFFMVAEEYWKSKK